MVADAFWIEERPTDLSTFNALYGYLKIGADKNLNATDHPKLTDVYTEVEPETDRTPSVLGRRSYIDDILIPATSWTSLYDKVERLLTACDRWNLSISLTKSLGDGIRWIT